MPNNIGLVFFVRLNQLLANYRGVGNVETAQVCLANKNLNVQISPSDFTCQVSRIPGSAVRDDYTHTPGIGYHKFHTQAKMWDAARKVCDEEGGHLAIVNSREEEKVLQSVFKKNLNNITNTTVTDVAFVGVHDRFETREWLTVLNEPLSSLGFDNWIKQCKSWGAQPDYSSEQHCGAITHKCEGMDNTWCKSEKAFFCEIPDNCS